jgi:hypothetical protein
MAHTGPCPTCAAIEAILVGRGLSERLAHEAAYAAPIRSAEKKVVKKVKRKVGKYQRVFGKKLKALKKKHPRTASSALMKRAHRETKKAMK